ncbi:hypothetical protein PAPYR_12200 [Paratrimastix pyriformis]|uniref:Uncharacterized protein n=1 Tax=Paratrimastix pyriformis TaxID=342808 RepID=A0ABQ8U295_9EUKA|nr:hypothetical protein PAPYR_12200 [Paratrimastix pyriformis]
MGAIECWVEARGGWVGSESLLFVGIVGIEGPLSAANCQTQIIRTSYSNLADACRLKNLRAGAIIRSDCSSQKTRPSLATEASGSNRIMIALTLLLHALDETLAEVNASLASGDGLTLRAIPGMSQVGLLCSAALETAMMDGCPTALPAVDDDGPALLLHGALPGQPRDCERYARVGLRYTPHMRLLLYPPGLPPAPAHQAPLSTAARLSMPSVGPITMSAVPHGLPLRGATWAEHLQPLRVTLDRLRDMYAKAGCLGPAALKAPGHAAGPSPLGAVWSVAVDGMWSPDVALQYLPGLPGIRGLIQYIEQPWPPQFFLELHIRFVATESAAQPSTVARLRRFSDRSGFAFGTGGRYGAATLHTDLPGLGIQPRSPCPAWPRLSTPVSITLPALPTITAPATPTLTSPQLRGPPAQPRSGVRERGVAVTPATAKPTPAPGKPPGTPAATPETAARPRVSYSELHRLAALAAGIHPLVMPTTKRRGSHPGLHRPAPTTPQPPTPAPSPPPHRSPYHHPLGPLGPLGPPSG